MADLFVSIVGSGMASNILFFIVLASLCVWALAFSFAAIYQDRSERLVKLMFGAALSSALISFMATLALIVIDIRY